MLGFPARIALVLLFGYSLSWVFAAIGLAVKDPDTAEAAAFPIMRPSCSPRRCSYPLNYIASWLQPFAEYQPVSVIIAVSAPIAVRSYRRAV